MAVPVPSLALPALARQQGDAGPALAVQQGNAEHPPGLLPPGLEPPAAPAGLSEADVKAQADLVAQGVGRKKAHEFLNQWRAENPQGTLDLTDRPDLFEWRAYMAHHPDRKMFFAGGRRLRKFKISRLETVLDNNTHDARVDFLAVFTDDTVIRLHPGSKDEAKPVLSTRQAMPQTCAEGHHPAAPSTPRSKGGAAAGGGGKGKGKKGAFGKGGGKGNAARGKGKPQAAPSSPRGNEAEAAADALRLHFEGISQADLVPNRAVKAWAEQRLQATRQAGTAFALDLTVPVAVEGWRTPMFLWCMWFNNVRMLAPHVPKVTEVWMVVIAGEPGFWFRGEDDTEYAVKFKDGGVTVESDRQVLWEIDWWA
jgi:hypothetical protein